MTKKRGPKPKVSKNDLLDELEKHQIFDEHGKLKTGKQHKKLWLEICKNLNYKIKKHNLIIYVAQNRNNIVTDLEERIAIRTNTNIEERKSDNVSVDGSADHNDHVESKCANNNEDLKNMLNIMLHIRNNALYKPVFKDFSQYPFSLMFWPKEAIELTGRLDVDQTFIFGSAGNLTQKFCVPDCYTSGDIISFIFGFEHDTDLIPLFQISTEENTKSIFKRFLTETMRDGFKAPKKIVIDHLIFICEAVVETFTESREYEYFLCECYTLLAASKSTKKSILPTLQLSIDLQSVIMKVKNWDFSDYDIEVLSDCKQFIIHLIFILSRTSTMEEFENCLYKVLILTQSQYENSLTNEFHNQFSKHVENLKIDEFYVNKSGHDRSIAVLQEASLQKIDFVKCSKIVEFLKITRDKAVEDIALEKPIKSIDNVFYNPSIAIQILELCVEFVVWTKVLDGLRDLEKNGEQHQTTMTLSTSLLTDYANNFLPLHENPSLLPIDEYILKSIDYTEKKIMSELNVKRKKIPKKSVKNEQDDSLLKSEENWMGLNYISDKSDISSASEDERSSSDNDFEDSLLMNTQITENKDELGIDNSENLSPKTKGPVEKDRGVLFQPFPQLCLVQQIPTNISRKRSIIRNANGPKMKAIKINGSPVRFLTSSTFDSFVEVLVSSCHLVSKFKMFLQTQTKKNDLLRLINEYSVELRLSVLYRRRAEILGNIMTNSINDKLYWAESMSSFIKQTIIPSIHQRVKCSMCHREILTSLSFISVDCQSITKNSNILRTFDSENIRFCFYCGNTASLENQIEHYVFFDLESTSQNPHDLYDLPIELSYKGKYFTLTGVIAHEPGLVTLVKHYTAFCRNFYSNSWTKYDDCMSKAESIFNKKILVQLAILIYIEYDLPLSIANQQLNMTLENKCDVVSEEHFAIKSEVFSHDKTVVDGSLTCVSKESSLKQLSFTELNASVMNGMNFQTSTPERSKNSTTEEMIISISEEEQVSISKVNENPSEKPKRRLSWQDIESAIVRFVNRQDETKISALYNKNKVKQRELIRNGGRQTEKIIFKIGDSKFVVSKFKNTCAIDCIFEVVTDLISEDSIALDMNSKKETNETILALANYRKSTFDMLEVLIYRAKILFIKHIIPDDYQNDSTIDCQANVCSMFRLLMESFPCLNTVSICSSCGKYEKRTQSTIPINYIRFFERGIKNLAQLIEGELEDIHRHCTLCIQVQKKHTVKVYHTVKNYLAVELEFMYERANKVLIYGEDADTVEDFTTSPKTIPLKIIVKDKMFLLKGIIEFQDPPGSLMHYIAYSRNISNNQWIKYNDILTNIEMIQLNQMTDMKIALLLYVAA